MTNVNGHAADREQLMTDRLRESEERYEAIVNQAPESVLIHHDGQISFVNRQAEFVSGFAASEIIGTMIYDHMTEDSCRLVKNIQMDRINRKVIPDYEIRFIAKNGRQMPLMVRSTPIHYDGKPAMLCLLIDISERKHAEEELKKKDAILTAVATAIKILLDNKQVLDAFAECAGILGMATGASHVYLFENELKPEWDDVSIMLYGSARRRTEWLDDGLAPGLVSIDEIVPFSRIQGFIQPMLNRQAIVGTREQLIHSGKTILPGSDNVLSMLVVPLFVNECFWGFLGFEDYHAKREWSYVEFSTLSAFANSLEKAIERHLSEKALEESRRAAEQANLLKSRFLANMSHEIRTPMNGIIGFLDLLAHSPLAREQQEMVHEARSASDLLLYLINDILDFSKIEAGKMVIENIGFNLRMNLEESVSLLMPRAADKRLELHLEVKSSTPDKVLGDPARLRQILLNLVGNAVKFTHEGEITVTAEGISVENGRTLVRLTVSDTGIGMTEEALEALFKPFSQGDASVTRKYGGTGLGLAITQELVRLMGGDIGVESVPGRGSSFICDIPFEIIDAPPTEEIFANLRDTRILVVDDSMTTRRIISTWLDEAGCLAGEAHNGEMALEMLLASIRRSEPYGCVIVSGIMQGMNGFDLMKAMDAMPIFKSVQRILVTSDAQRGDKAMARACGFSGYLAKPLKRDDLLDCLSLVLGRRNRIPPPEVITRYTPRERNADAKPRILLVEDNEINRKIIVLMLRNNDLGCDIAENGMEALDAMAEREYDIVLMDCQMPVMDGYEATRIIRVRESANGGRHTPIIAMTANAMEGDRERCLSCGMDDYISKPIAFDEVLVLIRNYHAGYVQEPGAEIAPSVLMKAAADPTTDSPAHSSGIAVLLRELHLALEDRNRTNGIRMASVLCTLADNMRMTRMGHLSHEIETALLEGKLDEAKELWEKIEQVAKDWRV